jgi:hypothetical protein
MGIKQVQAPSVWWKFDRYEISNGVIRPAATAKLSSWDPWSRFNNVLGHYRTVRTLWGELAELDRNLSQDPVASGTPSKENEKKILAWCNECGLLGLLPIRALSIELPPQYISSDIMVPPLQGIAGVRRALRTRYLPIAGHWLSQIKPTLEPSTKPTARSARPGMSIFWDWNELEVRVEETAHAIRSYYPEQIPVDRLPCPFSGEFWPLYQEPVQEWAKAVASFVESMELVSDHAKELREKGKLENENAARALWRLKMLAAREIASFSFGPRLLEEDASSASLLSALARMFLLDIQAGRRLFHCNSCQRIFVTNELKSKYCQVSCRFVEQGRRQRAHKREEKERKMMHLKQQRGNSNTRT